MRAAAAVAVLWATAAACSAAAPRPVTLTEQWPESPRAYGEANRDWTRSADLHGGFDKLLEVAATFKSPEWRAAYVAERAKRERLPAEGHAELLASEQQEATDYYDVQLIVATYDERENDLQKGKRSVWRLALIDDQGRQVTPISIKRDRRPAEIVRAYFPAMNALAQAYIARFPKDAALLREGASKFTLRMSSARGAVELVWPAR
jgi:hypothetical protein